MAHRSFIRSLRQLALLTVLLAIAGGSFLTRMRTTSWEQTLWVTIYPIAGDDSATTRDWIADLNARQFLPIESFMAGEASRYGVGIARPVRVDVGDAVDSQPPPPPFDGNPLSVAWWSLKLRLWAREAVQGQPGATPDIRMFVIYHDPRLIQTVPHSLGLQKGMLGVVHAFADPQMRGKNRFVITHEMLHTLGATDKYHPGSNLPIYPIGYAEPDASPRYPQHYAEIMGGRVPISPSEAIMPDSLKQTRVGAATALEIRWIDALPASTAGAKKMARRD